MLRIFEPNVDKLLAAYKYQASYVLLDHRSSRVRTAALEKLPHRLPPTSECWSALRAVHSDEALRFLGDLDRTIAEQIEKEQVYLQTPPSKDDKEWLRHYHDEPAFLKSAHVQGILDLCPNASHALSCFHDFYVQTICEVTLPPYKESWCVGVMKHLGQGEQKHLAEFLGSAIENFKGQVSGWRGEMLGETLAAIGEPECITVVRRWALPPASDTVSWGALKSMYYLLKWSLRHALNEESFERLTPLAKQTGAEAFWAFEKRRAGRAMGIIRAIMSKDTMDTLLKCVSHPERIESCSCAVSILKLIDLAGIVPGFKLCLDDLPVGIRNDQRWLIEKATLEWYYEKWQEPMLRDACPLCANLGKKNKPPFAPT